MADNRILLVTIYVRAISVAVIIEEVNVAERLVDCRLDNERRRGECRLGFRP
jgi:hypothetical protein